MKYLATLFLFVAFSSIAGQPSAPEEKRDEKPANVFLKSGAILKNVVTEKRETGAWVTQEGKRYWYPNMMLDKVEFLNAPLSTDHRVEQLQSENARLRSYIGLLEKQNNQLKQNNDELVRVVNAANLGKDRAQFAAGEAKFQAEKDKTNLLNAEIDAARNLARASEAEVRSNIATSQASAAKSEADATRRDSDTRAANSYINGVRDGVDIVREPRN